MTANFEARKRERYMRPAAAKEECPEGHARQPSSRIFLSVSVQMAAETKATPSGADGKRVRTYLEKLAISGLQRDSMSGRGLPMRFFRELLYRSVCYISLRVRLKWDRTYLVINHVPAQLMPNPSHPVNHSQSFLFQIKLFGTDFGTVGPGTRTKQTKTMIAAGARQETMIRTVAETVSGPCG